LSVRQTSIEAYECIYDDLGKKQKEVYDVIESSDGLCNQDIAEILGWGINRVTPRVKELRDFGLVRQGGYKLNSNGYRVMTWKM